MKRSEALKKIELILADFYYQGPADTHDDASELVLTALESAGLSPKQYVNPQARKDANISFARGENWAHWDWISQYPEHYYTHKNKRPYEFYLDGWEPEDA